MNTPTANSSTQSEEGQSYNTKEVETMAVPRQLALSFKWMVRYTIEMHQPEERGS